MSEHTYTLSSDSASTNFVVVAQAASPNLVLTKRNFANGNQKQYDNVKHFNFFQVEVLDLNDLYSLSLRMLSKPRCCFIRALIKDPNNCKNVVRKCKDDEATLVIQSQNWFAIDVDWNVNSNDDLESDLNDVLLALGGDFAKADCFAVASASYMFKPGIRMRVFFWADEPCSNQDLKRLFANNKAGVDLALFNPIQPIYTASPIGVDNVKQRIVWCSGSQPCVHVPAYGYEHGEENEYTKPQAERFLNSVCIKIGLIPSGHRHNELFGYSIFLGKLIGQMLLDEEETAQAAFEACEHWEGRRDQDKDMKTIRDGIERGKKAVISGGF